jgi:DNA-binding winged helix-turn-helix (wHTH) protein
LIEELAILNPNRDTLLVLIEDRGRLVEKDECMGTVWKGVTVEEGSLTDAIFRLRKALCDNPQAPQFIESRRG